MQQQRRLAVLLRKLDVADRSLHDRSTEPREGSGGWQHTALKVINALRCCKNVGNRGNLDDTVATALHVALPAAQARAVIEMQKSDTGLPHASTLSRSQAISDASMLLQFREAYDSLQDVWLYVWGDASPQDHVGEMFQTEFIVLRKEGAKAALHHAWELAGLQQLAMNEAPDADDGAALAMEEAFHAGLKRRTELGIELDPGQRSAAAPEHAADPGIGTGGFGQQGAPRLMGSLDDRGASAAAPCCTGMQQRRFRHDRHGHRARLGGL